MKGQSPSFQFYAADYLADAKVQMMTLEEEGAYIRLLAYCWREGSIPADPEQVSRLVKGGSTTLVSKVLKMFTPHFSLVDSLTHGRLEEERKKQAEWRAKSSRGGRNSSKGKRLAKARVVDQCLTNGTNQNATLQSSSSSSSSNISLGEKEPIPIEGHDRLFAIEDVRAEKATKRFTKPTPAEVTAYAATIGYALNGERFCNHYETRGWMLGNTKMKSWKGAVRTWKGNEAERAAKAPQGRQSHNSFGVDRDPESIPFAEDIAK